MKSVGRLILFTVIASLVTGCAGSTLVPAPGEGCSSLLPAAWREPVPSAVLGDSGDAALDWQLFGVAQTGQLKIANGDKADAIETVQRCEARDARAIRRVNSPAWMFWR